MRETIRPLNRQHAIRDTHFFETDLLGRDPFQTIQIGVIERQASAAILVLLMFLLLMNAAAILLRKRFERRY